MQAMIPAAAQHTISPHIITGLTHLKRWHNQDVSRVQTVAEHAGQVALLAMHIAPRLPVETAGEVLWWALVHDAHEVTFGDIPYPAREFMAGKGHDIDSICQDGFWGGPSENPARYLPDLVLDLVACADAIEAAIYAAKWWRAGAAEVRAKAQERIRSRLLRAETHLYFTRAMALLEEFCEVRA